MHIYEIRAHGHRPDWIIASTATAAVLAYLDLHRIDAAASVSCRQIGR